MKQIQSVPSAAFAAFLLAAALPARAPAGTSTAGIFLPADLTDLHPGTAWAPDEYAGFPASNAFDNETSTREGRWLSTYTEKQYDAKSPGELRWTFSDGPQVVRAYRLMAHVETDVERAPRSWIFQGSNDGGATWDDLDDVAWNDEPAWSMAESRVYSFENETAYETYRFFIRGTGGIRAGYYVGLQEVELFERLADEREDLTTPVDPAAVSAATDLTAPGGGNVTASSGYPTFTGDRMFDDDKSREGRWLAVPAVLGTMPDLADSVAMTVSGSPTHADFPVANAFDGNLAMEGRWLATVQPGGERAWLRWDFADGPQTVAGYGFKAVVYGETGRSPGAWTLSGSNDGGATWTVVHSASGEGKWALGEERLYRCDAPAAYSSYRFSFTENGTSDYIGLTEIELYSPSAMAANVTGCAWVQYVFDEPTAVDSYTLASYPSQSGGPERCPKSWRLFASDDGTAWTLMDRQTDEDDWGDYVETRSYSFANSTAFTHWRLVLDGRGTPSGLLQNYGYVGFSEMELRSGGIPVATSAIGETGFGYYAFDGDFTSASSGAWIAQVLSGTEKAWLSYDFGKRVLVDGYGLAGMAEVAARDPTAWTLSGSNDGGETWTVIDSRAGVTSWGPKVARLFDAASPGRYRIVRLALTAGATGAGSLIGLQEIELYGSAAPAGTVIVVR